METVNLIVSVLVLIGTGVLIWLTVLMVRTKRPTFRLDHMRVRPSYPDGHPDVTTRWPVALVFVNDGPGIAPGANAYATGALPTGSGAPAEIKYPHDGSPTVPVGGTIQVEGAFLPVPMPDGFHRRQYLRGDDWYFDFRDLSVRIEWGKPNRRGVRKSQLLNDLHRQQQDASPQFEKS